MKTGQRGLHFLDKATVIVKIKRESTLLAECFYESTDKLLFIAAENFDDQVGKIVVSQKIAY